MDGVLAVSPEGELLGLNRRFEEIWDLSPGAMKAGDALGDVVGRISAWVDEAERGDFEAEMSRSGPRDGRREGPKDGQRNGQPDGQRQLQREAVRPSSFSLVDGRRLTAYSAPAFGEAGEYRGQIWFFRDDSELLTNEAQQAELQNRLKAAERFQGYLLRAMNALAGATGYIETVEKLAKVVLPVLGDLFMLDVVDERHRPTRIVVRHADPASQAAAARLLSEFAPDPEGLEPAIQVIRTGRTRWSSEMSDAFLRATTQNEAHFKLVKQLGFSSYMSVPLFEEDRILGAATLVSSGSGRVFTEEDVALVEVLAEPIAQVVSRGLSYDRQHGIAVTLQESLLPPTFPAVDGVLVAARYVPGTLGAEVGGDFYDMVRVANGVIGMMVGDVAGHDPAAAAAMGQVRSASRALAGNVSTPAQLIDVMRRSWDLIGVERMTTVVYVRLDPSDGSLCLASAGHPPPILINRGVAIVAPVEPAPPFGVPPDAHVSFATGHSYGNNSENTEIPLVSETPHATGWAGRIEPGGALVLYTDGLVERRDRPMQEGIALLSDLIEETWNGDPDDLCEAIIHRFTVMEELSDDAALVVVSLENKLAGT
ncbi:MAG: GAF domain-containing SpoIIE family protein phosphatase [Acidimicrobiales bacterium]